MTAITIDEITTTSPNGSGTFDTLMKTVQTYLDTERKRMNATDYAKVYLGALDSVLQQSLAFTMGRQAADKQAGLLAAQAATEVINTTIAAQKLLIITEEVTVAEQKALDAVNQSAIIAQQLLLVQAEVSFAAEKELKLQADIELVEEQVLIAKQKVLLDTKQNLIATQQLAIVSEEALTKIEQGLLVDEELLLKKQEVLVTTAKAVQYVAVDGTLVQELLKQKQDILNAKEQLKVLTAQTDKIGVEEGLLTQKTFTEEAQIRDTVDDLAVTGSIGKQSALYAKQTDGFDRDAEQKLAKIVMDGFNVMYSNDPINTDPPTNILQVKVDEVLDVARTGAGVPPPP